MKAKYEFVIEQIDDRFVAVPVGDKADDVSVILNLNESAVDILRLLDVDRTEEQIVEELLKEYDVPREILAQRVHIGVMELINKEMVE